MTYIATFYTHFGAVNCARILKPEGIRPLFMPVPRKLSSSCGTCVKFDMDADPKGYIEQHDFEDLDGLYLEENGDYTLTYQTPRK